MSDIDAGTLKVTLTAANGTLTLANTNGLTFSGGDGIADATLTFSGQQSAINAALDGLRFSPTPGYAGTASISIVSDDQGQSGSGGARSDSDAVAINVQAISQPVKVVGFDVQRGALQRSFVRYVDLVFESKAGLSQLLAEDRLRVRHMGIGGGSNTPLDLTGVTKAVGNEIQLDFGVEGITGSRTSRLLDGYYRVSLDTDANGTFETVRTFYRLVGDTNSDQRVDSNDLDVVATAFGTSGANLDGDVNGDGVVNAQDRNIVRKQQGRALSGGLTIND